MRQDIWHPKPVKVTVTVWWLRIPANRYSSSLYWFKAKPEALPIWFQVVLSRFVKVHDRLRVDLVYPLTAIPEGIGDRDRKHLCEALRPLVVAALPDYQVAKWSEDRIDLEYQVKEQE